MDKRAIVFAPHPDDETLGCGGTIAKKLGQSYEIYVVFMTDGRHSLTELGVSSEPTPFEMKEIRRRDALRATEILGLHKKNLLFLDFEDKTLEKHEQLVQEKVVEILKDFSPMEVFFPQEREYHIDHRVSHRIIKRAIKTLNLNLIQYQYTIAWSFPLYLFIHFMNEVTFDLLMTKLLKSHFFYVDISNFLPLKEMAIEEYKSQITIISSKQKRPALKQSFLERFLKSNEKFIISNLRT